MPDVSDNILVYEEAEAELDELMKRRENLEDSLIYTNESSYLEEGGNLIHGFSGYLKPLSQQDKRKKEIIQEDRIFSNSSFNYEEKVMEFVTEEESSSSDEYNKKSGRSSLLANYSLNKRVKRTHKKTNNTSHSCIRQSSIYNHSYDNNNDYNNNININSGTPEATRIRLIISSRELKKEKQGQINT
ncbi:15041_t:CDS:2 [Entrophospora sp. SA101]|nr:15041_t:CDS:2 [Entrophospora sp. SA101]